MTEKRRAHPRLTFVRPVQFVCDRTVRCVPSLDISIGGLRLESGFPLPLDTPMKFFVPLPQAESGRARLCMFTGEVVWQHGHMVGVKFVDLPTDVCLQLSVFLAARNSVARRRGHLLSTAEG